MHEKKAPLHLQPETRRWWYSVVKEYEFSEHHLRLLTHAGEAWDRCSQARQILEKEGLTYSDRFGQPVSRPEVRIEKDARSQFAHIVKQLHLDNDDPPATPRSHQPRRGRV